MTQTQVTAGFGRGVQQLLNAYALTALRWAVGIVYVWFGALKLFQCTPVGQLVREAVPFGTPGWFVPALGALEIVMGVWFVAGRHLQRLLPLFAAHMLGTFSVLVFLPGEAYQHDHPWQLTMTGEFVVKNIVLLTAGLYVCSQPPRARRIAGLRSEQPEPAVRI